MQLRDYIEKALQGKTGRALAANLGIGANELTDAKGHRRGLPNHACIKLAKIIGTDPLEVIGASELVTEKNEERRQFWEHLLSRGIAASIALAFGLVANFLTPSPAAASNDANAPISQFALCKLSYSSHW